MDTVGDGWAQVPEHLLGNLPARAERLGDDVRVTREPAGFAPAPPVDCAPSGTNPRRCRLHAVRVTDAEGARWTITAAAPVPERPHPIGVPDGWPGQPAVPPDGTPVGDLPPDLPVAVACLDQGWAIVPDGDLRCRRTDLAAWPVDPPLHIAAAADPVQAISLAWRHRHAAAAVRFAGRWVWPDWLGLAPHGTTSVGPPEPGLDCRHLLVGVPRGRVGHLAVAQADVHAAKPRYGEDPVVLFRATFDEPPLTACGKPADLGVGAIRDVCKACLAELPEDSPVAYGPNVLGPEGIRLLGPDGVAAMLLTLLAA